MQIQVNGKAMTVDGNCTLRSLLDRLAITGGRLAVEVNEEIVPRSEHDTHRLADGDVVEIVHAIGGG